MYEFPLPVEFRDAAVARPDVLLRNPPVGSGQVGVKLRGSLCAVQAYISVSAIGGISLNPAKNCSFLNWKPAVPAITLMDGHELTGGELITADQRRDKESADSRVGQNATVLAV